MSEGGVEQMSISPNQFSTLDAEEHHLLTKPVMIVCLVVNHCLNVL